jgi:hypothetical protein
MARTFRAPVAEARSGLLRRPFCLMIVFVTALAFAPDQPAAPARPGGEGLTAMPTSFPASHGKRICGQRILRSPFDYHGRPGGYRSGKAGLPTFGRRGSDFPHDIRGVVVAADRRDYASYQLQTRTVYYLLPGAHIGSFMADAQDSFVGGYYRGRTSVLSGAYSASESWAIDSNSSAGNQSGVTIEYITIEKYRPNDNSAAVNPDSNTGWTIRNNLITLNVQGAGVILGAENVLTDNCMTLNGQYGFQSEDTNSWGADSLTGGPYGITVADNEISYNDTCDYEGLLDNSGIKWHKFRSGIACRPQSALWIGDARRRPGRL